MKNIFIQNWQIKVTRCGKSSFCLAFIAMTLIKLHSSTIYMAKLGIAACETKGDWPWVPTLQEMQWSSMESLWSHQQVGNIYSETTGRRSRLDRAPVGTLQGNKGKSITLRVSMETSTSQLSPRKRPWERLDREAKHTLLFPCGLSSAMCFNTKLCVTYGIKKRTDNQLWPNRCSATLCLEHFVGGPPCDLALLPWYVSIELAAVSFQLL